MGYVMIVLSAIFVIGFLASAAVLYGTWRMCVTLKHKLTQGEKIAVVVVAAFMIACLYGIFRTEFYINQLIEVVKYATDRA